MKEPWANIVRLPVWGKWAFLTDQSWCHCMSLWVTEKAGAQIPSRNRVARWHAGSQCYPLASRARGGSCVYLCLIDSGLLLVNCNEVTKSITTLHKTTNVRTDAVISERVCSQRYRNRGWVWIQWPVAEELCMCSWNLRTFCKVYLPFTTRVRQLYWLELVLRRTMAGRLCKKASR